MFLVRVARFLTFAVSAATLLLSCALQGDEKASLKPTGSGEPLRICTGSSYSMIPIIADQKGLFSQKGLKVEMTSYAIGRDAMEAMLAGKCDVATSADTPVADYGLKRDDLRVITGIAKSDKLSSVVVMRNSGIRKISDLRGHKVAVTKGTAPHFFLDLVLNKVMMTENDIRIQFMKGEELHRSFIEGKLDAIVTTDLNAYKIEENLGDKVSLINDPGIALNHGFLATLDKTLITRNRDLKLMFSALKAAENIIDENPGEAKQLFCKSLKISPYVAQRLCENITTRLSLDSAMVLTLEDNARWLKEREGGKGFNKSFKGIIKPELLLEVSPEKVNL